MLLQVATIYLSDIPAHYQEQETYHVAILSCSEWGLPAGYITTSWCALLPHIFTLTMIEHGGLFSVALSVSLHPLTCIYDKS